MTDWEDLQHVKKELVRQEAELIDLTMAHREASESKDVHILEKARQSVSEALVQIGIFEESTTGHVWRRQ